MAEQPPASNGPQQPEKRRARSPLKALLPIALLLVIAFIVHSQQGGPSPPSPLLVCKGTEADACLTNEAKDQYECENFCYFEDDPIDITPARMCDIMKEPSHEDSTPYLYRDTATENCPGGCITIGIGNKFESVDDAVSLQGQFMISEVDGSVRPATQQEIRHEYNNLAPQRAGCSNNNPASCYGASYYQSSTRLRLGDESINKLCQTRINTEFGPELRRAYPDFSQYPTRVQMAMFDMAYNLGVQGLSNPNKWPRLNDAIDLVQWDIAAMESKRPQLNADRNLFVHDLFEESHQEQEAAQRLLDQCTQEGGGAQ